MEHPIVPSHLLTQFDWYLSTSEIIFFLCGAKRRRRREEINIYGEMKRNLEKELLVYKDNYEDILDV